MAIDCEKLSLVNGEFGPNSVGHKYKPMPYHGIKAKKSKDKTRWNHPAYVEYQGARGTGQWHLLKLIR